jgi:hypothetical protein
MARVNLAASLPGLQRTAAAEAWLGGRPAEAPAMPIMTTAGAVQPASMPEGLMSKSDKEALFKRFIEWERSKEH